MSYEGNPLKLYLTKMAVHVGRLVHMFMWTTDQNSISDRLSHGPWTDSDGGEDGPFTSWTESDDRP